MLALHLHSFNSMKVRLKLHLTGLMFCGMWFQFHEGPIKTSRKVSQRKLLCGFNSMKVRLKRERQLTEATIIFVSIP